jgi:hypothetical protein
MDDFLLFEMLQVFEIGLDDRIAGGEFEHRLYAWYQRPAAGAFLGQAGYFRMGYRRHSQTASVCSAQKAARTDRQPTRLPRNVTFEE